MNVLKVAAPLALLGAVAACGGGDESSGPLSCEMGTYLPCACVDGSSGQQACQPDGTFGVCACAGSVQPPVPGPGTQPGPGTNPGTNPGMDPGMTDPGMTDPGMTDPGMTDPGMTDPPPPPPATGGSGCGNANPAPQGQGAMDVQGVLREYIVTLPPGYDPNTPYRLVLAWHPLFGDMHSIANGYYGLSYIDPNAIFATGQGLVSAVGGTGWSDPTDGPFARQLIEHVEANYCVDSSRIFSLGFSFGGIMSNRIGCEIADKVRAIAPGAGAGPAPAVCNGQTAAWLTHGEPDNVVPFTSGIASRDHWIANNGCSLNTVPTGVAGCVEYQGCAAGNPVVWCPTQVGHLPPSTASAGFDFATEAWAFFNRF